MRVNSTIIAFSGFFLFELNCFATDEQGVRAKISADLNSENSYLVQLLNTHGHAANDADFGATVKKLDKFNISDNQGKMQQFQDWSGRYESCILEAKKRSENINNIENALKRLKNEQDKHHRKISIGKNLSAEQNYRGRLLYLRPILDKLTCLEGWLALSSRDELQTNNNKFVLPVDLSRIIKIIDLCYEKSFVEDTGEVFYHPILGETSCCTYPEDYPLYVHNSYIIDDCRDLFDKLRLMNMQKIKDKIILECITEQPFDAIEVFVDESLKDSPVSVSFTKSNRINIELAETADHKLTFSVIYAIADVVLFTEKQYPDALSSKIPAICKYRKNAEVLDTLRADFAEVCRTRIQNVFRTISQDNNCFVGFINHLKKFDVKKIRETEEKYDMGDQIRSNLQRDFPDRQVSPHPQNFEECQDQDTLFNKVREILKNSDSIMDNENFVTFDVDFFRKLSQGVSTRPSSSEHSDEELKEISKYNEINQRVLKLNDDVRKNDQDIKRLEQKLNIMRDKRKEDPIKLHEVLIALQKELTQAKQQAESVKQELEGVRDFVIDRSQRKKWNITFALNLPKKLEIKEIKQIGCFNNDLNESSQRGSIYIHEVTFNAEVWTIWTSSYSDEYFVYLTDKLNVVSSTKNKKIQFHTMYPSLQSLSHAPTIDQDNLTAFIAGDTHIPTKSQLQKSSSGNEDDDDNDDDELLMTPAEKMKKKMAEQQKQGGLSQKEIDDFWKQ